MYSVRLCKLHMHRLAQLLSASLARVPLARDSMHGLCTCALASWPKSSRTRTLLGSAAHEGFVYSLTCRSCCVPYRCHEVHSRGNGAATLH